MLVTFGIVNEGPIKVLSSFVFVEASLSCDVYRVHPLAMVMSVYSILISIMFLVKLVPHCTVALSGKGLKIRSAVVFCTYIAFWCGGCRAVYMFSRQFTIFFTVGPVSDSEQYIGFLCTSTSVGRHIE